MIEPNYMEKLLEGVGVEWTILGDEKLVEVANSNRKPVKASLRISGEVPYYGANNIQDYVEGYTHDGVFILVAEDGSASLENYSIQWATGKFWANNHVHVLRGKGELDSRFLYHYLKTIDFIPFLSGGERAKLTKSKMVEIPIPIPPLKVQEEVVHILDAFTELTAELIAELTAELTARKKRYEYYRDKLLTFEEGEVEWKTLGEMSEIYDGTHQTPKYTNSGVPFVSVQNIKNLYATEKYISVDDFEKYKYKPRKDDLFMTRIGDIGTCAVVENDEPLAYYVTLTLIRVDQNIIFPKYLKHVIESGIGKLELHKRTLVHATPIKINLGEIGKINIPLPTLPEQARIVSILDKYAALTSSITEGLPREIELRQKQYEYYRNMLLTFPKEEVKA